MGTFDALADLPLTVEGYELEGLERDVSSDFTRRTTVIRLRGGGEEGISEDVVYDNEDHEALQDAGPVHDLAGERTLGEFCELIASLDLFPVEPVRGEVSRRYRRWSFDSAALDLALRQAGAPLHEALGRPPRPLSYVASLRLGEPASLGPVRSRLARYPDLRFKLDPTSAWTDDLIAGLQQTGAVDSIDFKGHYKGTPVDQPSDPVLYEKVARAFPDAWLEDPDLDHPAIAEVLADEHHRITWDAPISDVDSLSRLPFEPRMVNVKPSRAGGLRPLCALYDHLRERGIGAYGGGQFELGPGRGQVQYLAAIFHPDAPNDVSPARFHTHDPPPGIETSPLSPRPAAVGFRWEADG